MAGSRVSAVIIVAGYGLDSQGIGVLILERNIVLQKGSGAVPTAYPFGTGGSVPRNKAAGG
jgi:hypothetical protein